MGKTAATGRELSPDFYRAWGARAYRLCVDGDWSTQGFVDLTTKSQPMSEYVLVLQGFADAALEAGDSNTLVYTSKALEKIGALKPG